MYSFTMPYGFKYLEIIYVLKSIEQGISDLFL